VTHDVYSQIGHNPNFKIGIRILDIGDNLHTDFLNNGAKQLIEIKTDMNFDKLPDYAKLENNKFSTFTDIGGGFDIITYFRWDILPAEGQAAMDKIKTLLKPGGFVYIGGKREKIDSKSTEYEYLPAPIVIDGYLAITVPAILIPKSMLFLIRSNFSTVKPLIALASSGTWIVEATKPT